MKTRLCFLGFGAGAFAFALASGCSRPDRNFRANEDSESLGGAGTGGDAQVSNNTGGEPSIPVVACKDASDCDDGDPCNGKEKCAQGDCAAGTPLCENPDEEHCDCVATSNSCAVQPKDADKDGYGDALCPDSTGNDCDDSSATVHPMAPELCDGLDNNCNGRGDIQEGIPLSGHDPEEMYSSEYLPAGYYEKLYGNWLESMSSYYLVSGLRLQRVNRDGTINGTTVTLTTGNPVAGGSPTTGVLSAAVGETVGLIYTYGNGATDIGFSITGRGGDNISDFWVSSSDFLIDSVVGNYATGFILATLLDLDDTPELRLQYVSSNGSIENSVEENIVDAGSVQVAGGTSNLGVLVEPNAAAGSLELRLFDDSLNLQRKIRVGTGNGALGIRSKDIAVAYKDGDAVKLQVWDEKGEPICSHDLGEALPWKVQGSGDNWHVVFAEANTAPVLTVLSSTCASVDAAQLLDDDKIDSITSGEVQYLAGPEGSLLVWRNAVSATSSVVHTRFYGSPICQEALKD